jgi:hypothetical protein
MLLSDAIADERPKGAIICHPPRLRLRQGFPSGRRGNEGLGDKR